MLSHKKYDSLYKIVKFHYNSSRNSLYTYGDTLGAPFVSAESEERDRRFSQPIPRRGTSADNAIRGKISSVNV